MKNSLNLKNDKVRNNLMRIGGFSEAELDSKMQPPVGADSPYRYRNKAQFPVGYDRDGNIVTGFYASRSHNIIGWDCKLGVPQNKEILDIIKQWMNECGIRRMTRTHTKARAPCAYQIWIYIKADYGVSCDKCR